MYITLLKSKIHHAEITDANVNYEGSLTIDSELMAKVGILPYEKILVANLANGKRFETYAIEGKQGARDIILNGATAHLGKAGNLLTIFAWARVDEKEAAAHKPSVIVLSNRNRDCETR